MCHFPPSLAKLRPAGVLPGSASERMRPPSTSQALVSRLLFPLLLGLGCSSGPGTAHDPRPQRMVPARGLRQVPVEVRIEGENFQPVAVQQLGGPEPVRVDRHFAAFLGDTALEDVEWVDARALRARVPAGLAPGVYPLVVVSPLGRRVQLEQAFLVAEQTFGQLSPRVEVDRTELLVEQDAQVALTLTNPGDAPVRDVVAGLRVDGPAEVQLVEDASLSEVPPGGSVRRRWRVRGQASGTLTLHFEVGGTDAESGVAVAPAALPAQTVQVHTPASLVAQGVLTTQRASVGQELDVQLMVLNEGETPARAVLPELAASGQGSVDVLQAPVAEDLTGGALHTFTWRLRASDAGATDLTLQARGVEALSGAGLSTGSVPAGSLLVEWPATLVGSIAGPTRVSVGQPFLTTVTVDNVGQALARAVSPTPLQLSGGGMAEQLSTLTAQDVPGGERRTFSWSMQATRAGTLLLTTEGRGADANSGAIVGTGPLQASPLQVQTAAALRAEATLSPSRVNVGQPLRVDLQVSNDGEADALDVLPAPPVPQGSGALTLVSAPSAATVPGGGSQIFSWTFSATAVGDVALSTSVSGRDANSGFSVGAGPVATPPVQVQLPASLAATLSAPVQVSTGQTFQVSLTVRNTGGADAAGVTPSTPLPTGPGTASLVAGPSPASVRLAAGEQHVFTWQYVATGAGALHLETHVTGEDGNDGSALGLPAPAAVDLLVQRAAALVGSLESPGRVSVGQLLVFTLTVQNTGEAAALGVLPAAPQLTGDAGVERTSAPGAQDVPGGESRSFQWSYRATGPGQLALASEAQGTDANGGAAVTTGLVSGAPVEVQTAAALSGTASVMPAQVSVGQQLFVELSVSNTGQADAVGVQPASPTLTGTGALSLVSAPPADTLPGGGSHVFRWTYTATRAGTVSVSTGASGTDANSGAPVETGTVSAPPLRVQVPASLQAALAAPTRVSAGQAFTVSLEVVAGGEASTLDVTPSLSLLGGTGAALLTQGPVLARVSLLAGERHVFTWQYTATGAGTLRFGAGASGTDANSGAAVSAPAPAPVDVAVQRPAALTAVLDVEPATANVGQLVTVSLSVQNTGEAAAVAVVPEPPVLSGTGSASPSSGPVPTSATVAGGGLQVFTWQYTATGAGSLTVRTSAAGTEANTGAVVATGPVSAPLTLQRPAQLLGTLSVSRRVVDEGQLLTLALHVQNAGEATAVAVSAGVPAVSGTSSAALESGPGASGVTLAGGQSVDFTWTYRAGSSGSLGFAASASGTDANTGAAVGTGPLSTPLVEVQQPSRLVGSLTATPAVANEGQRITLSYTVQNTGEAIADGVAPAAPLLSGTSSATLVSSPSPASVTLPGGTSQTFSWQYTLGSAGGLAFETHASGTDDNTGAALTSAASSTTVTVQTPAALVGELSLPASVSEGQPFTLTLTVQNTGQSAARAVTPGAPSPSGTGTVTLVSGPSPDSADIPAGATQRFTWQYTGTAAGPVTLGTSASGTDVTNGSALGTGPLTSPTLTVQRPAALVGTLTALPQTVSQGQSITLTLTVQNTGEAMATAVTPGVLALSGTGGATPVSGPSPTSANIAGGTSRTFSWQYTAGAAGTLRFGVDAAGMDANSGATVSAPLASSALLTVQRPAALTAALASSLSVVNEDQPFTLTLTVRNTGEAAASGVVPALPLASGTSTATRLSGPTPASATIGGGQSQSFTWQYSAAPAGDLGLASSATGKDANSGTTVGSAQASTPSITVQRPATLVAGLAAPASVTVGQDFTLTLTVSNTGDATATAVTPGAPTRSGTAGLTLLSGPTPASATVSPGSSQRFQWTWRGTSDGSASFQMGASGTDATDGRTVTAATATSGTVSVQPPATLSASLTLPGVVGLGETFSVTMTVRNDGGASVLAAAPSGLTVSGTAAAALVSGPTPASATLAAGQSQSYTWQYTATSEGSLTLSGSASGTDANSGYTVVSPPTTSSASSIRRAIQLVSNPFLDGTSFSFVFKYDEHVYLGPNKNGTGGVRTLPDGSGAQSFSFSFPKDVTGNYSANTLPGPFTSIGRSGCTANTYDCGPDNENGRGMFFSGTLNGQEWLTASGVNTNGNFDYLEMTTDKDSVLDFRYVDLNSFVGGQARGISSARVYADSIYLGLPDTTGNRPGIIALHKTPDVPPGLDVSGDSMAVDLDLDAFEYFGANLTDKTKANPASLVMVDAMAEFNGRLYLANNGGCVRTTVTNPRPYGNNPSDWATCRPTHPAYTDYTSITLSSPADIEPKDRAVPQMAVFGGRLYMARNTTAGPQLFVCTPGTSGSATDCDAGDWALVAPNTTGDTQLTQFNTLGNTRITLLAATSAHLYVGFNNASGLVVFRTANPTARTRGDFQGLQDCSAANAPTSCEGLGQNGLGVGATRIFDGTALTFSSTSSLYLVVGTGADPVRVFRIAD